METGSSFAKATADKNLKLDRHATYESLGSDSKLLVDAYATAIYSSLRFWNENLEAALSIMHRLQVNFGLKFEGGVLPWINQLVMKWREKTPDLHEQSKAIAFAIYKQRRS